MTNTFDQWKATSDYAKQNRKDATAAEDKLWQHVRNRKLKGHKFRRQHPVAGYIPDFVCIERKLIVEVDGGYHEEEAQKNFDISRSKWLEEHDYKIIRVTNNEVIENVQNVLKKIGEALSGKTLSEPAINSPSPLERGSGGEVLKVYTTRPDTIFGVDFMVLAPEHELVPKITSGEQKPEINKYLEYVESRSERERLAEVKQITGAFTGAYAINPFDGREIPIWISEYVLAGYGTGAIMAVPCGDQRDFAFAKHFNIPITNIIGDAYNGNEANPQKMPYYKTVVFLTEWSCAMQLMWLLMNWKIWALENER
jgi:leucyl-tRNA synthetase